MSRIGKRPITIQDGVDITIQENVVTVKGPKGTLTQEVSRDLNLDKNDQEKVLTLTPKIEDKKTWGMWGLYRVLINNMVVGVSQGFTKVLEIHGIGYKVEQKGSNILVSVGYSHPILFIPEEGITLKAEGPTKISVSGIDKQMVGQIAANIRGVRPPEPYKGKGIRYEGEYVRRKVGKAGA